MAFTKETKTDRIEIVGDEKNVQVREAIIVKEDGSEISRSFRRRVISKDDDISMEDQSIQDLCNLVQDR